MTLPGGLLPVPLRLSGRQSLGLGKAHADETLDVTTPTHQHRTCDVGAVGLLSGRCFEH